MAFTLTPEQRQEIAKTRADKAKWERVIAKAQIALDNANRKLEAVATLTGGAHGNGSSDWIEESGIHVAAEETSDNMTAKIEEIANAPGNWAMSHRQMRDELRKLGFPEDRLGNYYYTAIHRLKAKDRISISADKKISGAHR